MLDEQVRPDLRADGGDIVVVGIDEDNIVRSPDRRVPGMFFVGHHADHAGRGHPQGADSGDPLPRGGSLISTVARKVAEPRWRWPRAAYVHVPFCAHKCGYCDFASLAGVDHLADRYLTALEREIERDARRTPGGRHDLRRRGNADPARCRARWPG